jgi:hypothetical protein
MKITLKTFIVGLLFLGGLAATGDHASAQALISLSNLATDPTLVDNNGNYQLSSSTEVNLDTAGLPSALNSSLGMSQNSSGWAFQGATGNAWIANLDLGDPSVSYAIAFQNDTATTQTYTVTFSVPINPSVTLTPSFVRATVAGTLLNGGTDPNTPAILTPVLDAAPAFGTSGAFLQTSTLTLTTGSNVSTNVDLTPGIVSAAGNGGQTTFQAQTLNYNLFNGNGPSGTFDALSVTLGFTLSAGDDASFTGRVDVTSAIAAVPEPSSVTLSLIGLGLLALFARLRRSRMA